MRSAPHPFDVACAGNGRVPKYVDDPRSSTSERPVNSGSCGVCAGRPSGPAFFFRRSSGLSLRQFRRSSGATRLLFGSFAEAQAYPAPPPSTFGQPFRGVPAGGRRHQSKRPALPLSLGRTGLIHSGPADQVTTTFKLRDESYHRGLPLAHRSKWRSGPDLNWDLGVGCSQRSICLLAASSVSGNSLLPMRLPVAPPAPEWAGQDSNLHNRL